RPAKIRGPEFSMPEHCPACGAATVREADKAVTRCTGGLSCRPQALFAITHFGSRLALDIDGLGEGKVTQLMEAGLLARPSGLASLNEARMAMLEGWGPTSAKNLVENIDKARNPEL